MSSQEMRKIMNLMESFQGPVELEITLDELDATLNSAFEWVADKWKEHASDEYKDRPAGPDTTKFSSRSYSMIKPTNDVTIHRGMSGLFHTFRYFLQLGNEIDAKTRKAIITDLENIVLDSMGVDVTHNPVMVTSDGHRLVWDTISGSSWGGAGFILTE